MTGRSFRIFLWGVAALAIPTKLVAQDGCGPTRVEIEAEVCTPFGEEFTATIWLRAPAAPVVGGQFFIEYSFTNFEMIGFSVGDEPFTSLLLFNTPMPGFVQLAPASISLPASTDTVMARLTFLVIHDAGDPYLRFHLGAILRNRLSREGGAEIIPVLDTPVAASTDLHDFADLQNCFSGDGGPAHPDCRCELDRDRDRDVDSHDWRMIQSGLTGPAELECRR